MGPAAGRGPAPARGQRDRLGERRRGDRELGQERPARIRNRLAVICEHLLKWAYRPEHRSGSWRESVVEARDQIARLVRESPSLRDYPAAVVAEAYPPGRRKAEAETGLGELPESCPWTIDEVLDHALWPSEGEA